MCSGSKVSIYSHSGLRKSPGGRCHVGCLQEMALHLLGHSISKKGCTIKEILG